MTVCRVGVACFCLFKEKGVARHFNVKQIQLIGNVWSFIYYKLTHSCRPVWITLHLGKDQIARFPISSHAKPITRLGNEKLMTNLTFYAFAIWFTSPQCEGAGTHSQVHKCLVGGSFCKVTSRHYHKQSYCEWFEVRTFTFNLRCSSVAFIF